MHTRATAGRVAQRQSAALTRRTSQVRSLSRPPSVSFAGLAIASVLAITGVARAEQPRDFMLSLQPTGTFAMLDYFGSGAQLSIEHRESIYGNANDFTLGATTLQAFPGGEATLRADLRVLFLSFGGTVAYRAVWRSLNFDAGGDRYCVRCDRKARRDIDSIFGQGADTDHYAWAEARVQLLVPLNEYVVLASLGALRSEDSRPREYDWFFASVHDGGLLGRWETQLFVKHRDWGGIGPYLQLMELPRAGEHVAQWAIGFNAVTRLGLMPRNDFLFLTFLTRPGDASYGQHAYYAPIRALLVYRMILDL